MAKVCQVTGKRASSGHNVSHSVRRTKRRFLPNLQFKWIEVSYYDKNGNLKTRMIRLRIATSTLRTIYKEPSKHERKKLERKAKKRLESIKKS